MLGTLVSDAKWKWRDAWSGERPWEAVTEETRWLSAPHAHTAHRSCLPVDRPDDLEQPVVAAGSPGRPRLSPLPGGLADLVRQPPGTPGPIPEDRGRGSPSTSPLARSSVSSEAVPLVGVMVALPFPAYLLTSSATTEPNALHCKGRREQRGDAGRTMRRDATGGTALSAVGLLP
jgi:hypothetical protein